MMEAAAPTPPPAPDASDKHPWPYFKEMFTYLGVKDGSYRMKCLLCLPKTTKILAFKNSLSNLKKHVVVS